MKGVILAAGRGKRLNPLTSRRPKHLLPIIDKPLIRKVVEAVAETGINDICIVVGYGSEKIIEALKNFTKINITFAVQREQLGTADALLSAESFLKDADKFLVVYGDLTLEPQPLKELIKIVDLGYDGGIIGIKHSEGKRFGVISLKNGMLERIVEKPDTVVSTALINSGIYVLPREVLEAARRISKSIRGEYELTDAVTKLVEDGYRIAVHIVEGEWWLDVGRPSDLLIANLRNLSNSYIHNDAKISNEAVIQSSVIMKDVKVDQRANIKSSLVLENAYIRPSVLLNYCIIGEDAEIGDYSCLNGELSQPIVVGPGARVSPKTQAPPGTIFQ